MPKAKWQVDLQSFTMVTHRHRKTNIKMCFKLKIKQGINSNGRIGKVTKSDREKKEELYSIAF